MKRLAAVLGALAVLTGCADRPAIWNQPLALTGPVEVGSQAMWVDATRGGVFALDADASPPEIHGVAIRRNATSVVVSRSTGQLVVASAGREALEKGQEPEPPELALLTPQPGAAPRVESRWPLPAPFDRVAISPDGKTAIAWFSGSAPSTGFFVNPNELAIVDLTRAAAADNPVFRTIRSLGATPTAVIFSPPMPVPAGSGTPRHLALVLSQDYLTFLDLGHPTRSEITVPLKAEGSSATILPEQVIFSPDTATLFVRASGASDVYALALEERTGGDATANDYLPRVNQPSAGKTALDMTLYHEDARTIILTANDSKDLALIDAGTSEFAIIPMGVPVDAILPIPAENPQMAVLFSRRNPQMAVYFLDLKNLTKNLDQNLTRRQLARPVHDIVAVPGGGQLLVVHDDQRTVISILDLGPHRTDTPIQGPVALDSFDFAGGYLVGVSAGILQLGMLDLTSLNPLSVRLDYSPRRVLALGRHVIVDHARPEGLVTVVPDPQSTREDTRVLWGFLLEGLIDSSPKD